jgi:alkyl hydroperoxide reductase subunit AhpC
VRAFGIAQEFRGLREVARRSTFLIDGEGIVRATWIYENTDVPDVEDLLGACLALRPSDRSA